ADGVGRPTAASLQRRGAQANAQDETSTRELIELSGIQRQLPQWPGGQQGDARAQTHAGALCQRGQHQQRVGQVKAAGRGALAGSDKLEASRFGRLEQSGLAFELRLQCAELRAEVECETKSKARHGCRTSVAVPLTGVGCEPQAVGTTKLNVAAWLPSA